MEPVLVGDRNAIAAAAERIDWDIGRFEIVDAADEPAAGMTAAKLCGDGAADALMKGHIHTDAFVRGILSRDTAQATEVRRFLQAGQLVPDDLTCALVVERLA